MSEPIDPQTAPARSDASRGLAEFITIPARAREEIGQLAFYLDQMLRNLRQVNDHLRGSSRDVPSILHELKDIVKMTEDAAVRVLEETEALMKEGKEAASLIAEAELGAERAGVSITEPLQKLSGLVALSNRRNLAIMSALEFQDLTAQKVQRAFEVLDEVVTRLATIQSLVDLGEPLTTEVPGPVGSPIPAENNKANQALVDELLLGFER